MDNGQIIALKVLIILNFIDFFSYFFYLPGDGQPTCTFIGTWNLTGIIHVKIYYSAFFSPATAGPTL